MRKIQFITLEEVTVIYFFYYVWWWNFVKYVFQYVVCFLGSNHAIKRKKRR